MTEKRVGRDLEREHVAVLDPARRFDDAYEDVVFDGEQTRVVDDLEVRDPGPGEVLVGIRAAGLCHSDLSVVDGTIPFPVPVVLGQR